MFSPTANMPTTELIARTVLGLSAGFGLFLLIGCGGEDDLGRKRADGVVEHPFADSIPYDDRDHILIDRGRTVDEMEDPPEEILGLLDYLEAPEGTDRRKLEVFVSSSSLFDVTAVDEHRLVMLDSKQDRFLEYDLKTDEVVKLAKRGEGPGDIQLAQEMVREGPYIYVAMEDRRISWFDCRSAPCTHESEMRVTELRPASFALAGEQFAVLARGTSSAEEKGVVRLVDRDGGINGSFGSIYYSEHPSVRLRFTQGVEVHYLEDMDQFALIFNNLPYIHLYDESGNLQSTYKISHFIQGTVKYGDFGRPTKSVRLSPQDRSIISYAKVLNGHVLHLVVGTSELVGGPDSEGQVEYETKYDYYAVDLLDGEGYHVGSEEGGGIPYITDTGIVNNDNGSLSFYKLQ